MLTVNLRALGRKEPQPADRRPRRGAMGLKRAPGRVPEARVTRTPPPPREAETPFPPDDELVRETLAGSEEAFVTLVKRHEDRVFTVVYRLVSNREDAEDVTQEAFTKAFARLSSFTFQSAFFTWLYRIAVNAAADFMKQRRRRRTTPLDDVAETVPLPGGASSRPDRSATRSEVRERLKGLIAELPPVFRTVLVLRELEDLPYEEIARIVGCSIGTVESRLFRARARIRDGLAPFLRASGESSC